MWDGCQGGQAERLARSRSPLGGRILERLPRLLASKHRVCYTAVADVLGLTLRKMNEGVAGVQASFQGAVEGELAALLRAGQRDQYLLALLHICRLYQPLAARYASPARAHGMHRVALLCCSGITLSPGKELHHGKKNALQHSVGFSCPEVNRKRA